MIFCEFLLQRSLRRSLDLTGPLLLGGVPKLPEEFPVRSRQFIGCMKDLRIDEKHIDMAGFIANNGTLAGEALLMFYRNYRDGEFP